MPKEEDALQLPELSRLRPTQLIVCSSNTVANCRRIEKLATRRKKAKRAGESSNYPRTLSGFAKAETTRTPDSWDTPNEGDRDGAKLVLVKPLGLFPQLQVI